MYFCDQKDQIVCSLLLVQLLKTTRKVFLVSNSCSYGRRPVRKHLRGKVYRKYSSEFWERKAYQMIMVTVTDDIARDSSRSAAVSIQLSTRFLIA